ncbi:extensin family protein, partial [Azospirillum soli]|uniref:extensin family protein n=1 Tax=Azospirillum soli TaxID=1304799 RepID=UPI001AE9B5C1
AGPWTQTLRRCLTPTARASQNAVYTQKQSALSPDYNAAHRDHFHLDMGRFRTCR